MLGAIIGDIVGSRFEWHNIHTKSFDLFTPECFATDDSIMTLAIGKAIMDCNGDYYDLDEKAVKAMQEVGRPYPDCGYGGRFLGWMYDDDPQPYNSFGNGAAMRVSPCGDIAESLDEAKTLSRIRKLIRQAQAAAEDFCRVSFDEDAPQPVRLACLLFISHYYENRDAFDQASWRAMRIAFENLLYPYRDPEKMF